MIEAKVQGHSDLIKNSSGAIVNNNKEALKKARLLKQQKLKEIEKINQLETKIESLENLVEKLVEEIKTQKGIL